MNYPIGQLQTKSTAYCTICGCSTRRNIKVLIYKNTPEEIERAKSEIAQKIDKSYTCRICVSIVKDVKQNA
jgi:hypothetical protein